MLRQDWRPIGIALGQWLAMCMSLAQDEITLASRYASSESCDCRELSEMHNEGSMPIELHNLCLGGEVIAEQWEASDINATPANMTSPILQCHVTLQWYHCIDNT